MFLNDSQKKKKKRIFIMESFDTEAFEQFLMLYKIQTLICLLISQVTYLEQVS